LAVPVTVEDLVQIIRKSGLIAPAVFDAFLGARAAADGRAPGLHGLVGELIRDGLLTHFHAEQLLLGKTRGFTLGRYKLLERIGSGGMGQVFLAEHMDMHRKVAIKVLPPDRAVERVALGRFFREARAAGMLDHPNVVRFHDLSQDRGLYFFVMEYVHGVSFGEIVRRTGAVELARACGFVSQAAVGLQHLHEAGLVHRDIKPGNLMVDHKGVVKILDLGLVRIGGESQNSLTRKYDDKAVLGTVDFIAPEQAICSHKVDIRADIYSLGVTFYFLLSAKVPFAGSKLVQKLILQQTQPTRPLHETHIDIPRPVSELVARMLARDPDERPQTPRELVEALAPWVREQAVPDGLVAFPNLSPAALAAINGVAGAVTVSEAPITVTESEMVRPERLWGPAYGDRPPADGAATNTFHDMTTTPELRLQQPPAAPPGRATSMTEFFLPPDVPTSFPRYVPDPSSTPPARPAQAPADTSMPPRQPMPDRTHPQQIRVQPTARPTGIAVYAVLFAGALLLGMAAMIGYLWWRH
jgi:serine/threonine protein kinase